MFYIQDMDQQSSSLAFSPSLTPVILGQGRMEDNKAKNFLQQQTQTMYESLYCYQLIQPTVSRRSAHHLSEMPSIFSYSHEHGPWKTDWQNTRVKVIQPHRPPLTQKITPWQAAERKEEGSPGVLVRGTRIVLQGTQQTAHASNSCQANQNRLSPSFCHTD